MRARLRVLFAAVVALGCLVAPGVAIAAEAPGTLVVRSLDASQGTTVKAVLQYTGPLTNAVTGVTVRENGKIVPKVSVTPISQTATEVGVVLVVDTSGSMRTAGRIDAAKQAVRAFVNGRGPKEQIALVAFADQPSVMHNFSADAGAANAADGLTATGETALWDALRVAVGLFNDRPGMQPNILVLSDGVDSVSTVQANEVTAAAKAAHVPVSAIGLTGPGFDGSQLDALANATGGRFLASSSPDQLGGVFDAIRRDLNQQFQVTWDTTSVSPSVDFQLQGATIGAVVPDGGTSRGTLTQPQLVAKPGFLGGSVGLVAVLLLAGATGVAVALGAVLLARSRSNPLRSLNSYGDVASDEPLTKAKSQGVVSTDLVRRAVEFTATAGEGLGLFGWIEHRLEVARLPLRAAEAMFFTFAFGVVGGLGAAVMKGPLFGLLAMTLVFGGAAGALEVAALRTTRKFVRQLPIALQLLASSLRAGYSLLQGCDAVAVEIGGPLGAELRRALAEARLGRPIEDALQRAADRMDNADFKWVVMAINIQREVGGNLAELLDTVAGTMRARAQLKGEVKALTAEGRASAIMLGIMPPALGIAMATMSPGYLDPLFNDSLGNILLGGAVVGVIGGFIWMQKIVKVDL